jgi:hypothetical protein
MIEMPQSTDSAALKAAKMYSQAGLRIVDTGSGPVATDMNGGGVTLPVGAVTTTTFYDQREGMLMQATQVDVSLLGSLVTNGVLYVASTANGYGPTKTCNSDKTKPCPVVRLVNGATLPNGGLTVVSQNPVYVQGDYNTTNNGPTVNGVQTHQPAAVMADAITVLSNQWSDANAANSSTSLSNRTVTAPTTVNAAFALGPSTESAQSAGNGQLENSIRFLENWSGQPFNYNGSIIALWHSEQVKGAWISPGTYYNPPVRNWAYDTLFNSVQPKGAPVGVIMTKGRWSQS